MRFYAEKTCKWFLNTLSSIGAHLKMPGIVHLFCYILFFSIFSSVTIILYSLQSHRIRIRWLMSSNALGGHSIRYRKCRYQPDIGTSDIGLKRVDPRYIKNWIKLFTSIRYPTPKSFSVHVHNYVCFILSLSLAPRGQLALCFLKTYS
jgi:hypothetical protein